MSNRTEKSIFFEALEIDHPAQRDAFLRRVCDHDDALYDSVTDLLKRHEGASICIDRPIVGEFGSPTQGDETIDQPFHHDFSSHFDAGTLIGNYKLRELIGEGGFGLVFVADQLKPVKRRVALKLVKPGTESQEVLNRFEAERQALAMMDHPSIARVFDAGATDTGQPYFVMELVRGIPLTTFCDNHRLGMDDRLDLLIKICHAVLHAHQKGIIHRDLKPNNVLVTLQDGKPLPKVIDFGVAKAIGQRLASETIYTRFTAMVGTPAYMSPEQAEMTNAGVDTRCDIYALGVLMYELLTGSPPLSSERLQTAGFDELRRMIREEEPERPSKRVSSLDQARRTTVSMVRHTDPTRLESMLQGDLDWIAMKALEKNRERRYATAAELAEDLTRYLTGDPVLARPPTLAYRLSRFAKRNKVTIVSTALIALSLMVGTAVSAWQASVATEQRDRATDALGKSRRSESFAIQARQDLQEFVDRLKRANSLLAIGRAHVEAGRLGDAFAVYGEAIETQPHFYQTWAERGSFYARHGLWKLAANDFIRAVELGGVTNQPDFLGVPQLLWFVGEREIYGEIYDKLSALEEDRFSVEARGRLVNQISRDDAAELASFAESKLKVGGYGDWDRMPDPQDWSAMRRRQMGAPLGAQLYLAGWAHLEAKNYSQAITRLKQAEMETFDWRGSGISAPLIALAYERQGEHEQAMKMLSECDSIMEKFLALAEERRDFTPNMPWFDWLDFLINYRKASQEIAHRQIDINGRLESLQSKALQAIAGTVPTP
ncbi:serine/threonine-protein kinase [Roseiconus lacunae]|uniref:protein kinase domain-containing protein n=1 Tax=Roseiconus lacunae TaxID=2605694 RepID=UPI0030912278|nr:serine/threonine-protein kinase [Stieleria sp. HD01]